MLVPDRYCTPCYTPMSMWSFITKFPFSKWTSFRKWAMDRSCSRTGTSWHCTSISCWDKECLKPQPTNHQNGWLRKNTTTSTVSKASRIPRIFQGSNFSNIRCQVETHNQMVSPRYCDSRISRKWPEWCSFKRKAPGDYGAVFLCNDFKDKTWKKTHLLTFWGLLMLGEVTNQDIQHIRALHLQMGKLMCKSSGIIHTSLCHLLCM